MSSFAVSSSYGPFTSHDLFQYACVQYLELSDIAHASQVCKSWKQLVSNQNLWKALSEREGIPLVGSTKEERNYKKELEILYPITLSGKIISQYFGKVVEKVPPISEEEFNKLQQPDPFEEGKLKLETFIVVVDPSFVMRTVDQETPLALDYLENLIESPKQENEQKRELKIPLSSKNIKVLSSYPLKGKENMPVFDYVNDEVFQQCNTRPDKISVYIMRRHVVDQSRGKPYAEQERLVKKEGFEVTPLRERLFFDVISILKDGTCPDNRDPQWRTTYARTSDIVHYDAEACHPVVGGFAPRAGVRVSYDYGDGRSIGVVPGGPAEVPAIVT